MKNFSSAIALTCILFFLGCNQLSQHSGIKQKTQGGDSKEKYVRPLLLFKNDQKTVKKLVEYWSKCSSNSFPLDLIGLITHFSIEPITLSNQGSYVLDQILWSIEDKLMYES